MSAQSAQMLKGHLDLLLLAACQAGPLHGYALIDRLRLGSDGQFDLPEGTIYPALHRLEQAGLLTSRWSDESPRRRRLYELTGRGRTTLEIGRQTWRSFESGMNTILFGGLAPEVGS
jgi:DNA-binding PadR family transcriptional regulator